LQTRKPVNNLFVAQVMKYGNGYEVIKFTIGEIEFRAVGRDKIPQSCLLCHFDVFSILVDAVIIAPETIAKRPGSAAYIENFIGWYRLNMNFYESPVACQGSIS
jgi:hypothetical protein